MGGRIMTSTPETDNLARGNHVVPTEFAQQLERELTEARKEIEGLHYALKQSSTIYDVVTEQRDKLTEVLQEMQYDRSDKAIKMANELLQSLTMKHND
jgi:replicative DNA helicase